MNCLSHTKLLSVNNASFYKFISMNFEQEINQLCTFITLSGYMQRMIPLHTLKKEEKRRNKEEKKIV